MNIDNINCARNLSLEDFPNEVWKEITNYPDYLVSNLGRIKSLKAVFCKILKQGSNFNGENYIRYQVHLSEKGKSCFC